MGELQKESEAKVSIKSVGSQSRLLLESKERKPVSSRGRGVVYQLFAEEIGWSFSVTEHPLQPRTLVPLHSHTDDDEFSIFFEIKFGIRSRDRIVEETTPRCYIPRPRGNPHGLQCHRQPGKARRDNLSRRFEAFQEEAAKLFPSEGLPDATKVTNTASRHHVTQRWNEWVPELMAKNNLELLGS